MFTDPTEFVPPHPDVFECFIVQFRHRVVRSIDRLRLVLKLAKLFGLHRAGVLLQRRQQSMRFLTGTAKAIKVNEIIVRPNHPVTIAIPRESCVPVISIRCYVLYAREVWGKPTCRAATME